jgi:hypothetical protein
MTKQLAPKYQDLLMASELGSSLESLGATLTRLKSERALSEHLRQESRKWAKAFKPLPSLALLRNEPTLQRLAATTNAIRSAALRADEDGKRELAQLHKHAHKLTRSRAHLSVRMLRLTDRVQTQGRPATAYLLGSAFNGSQEARRYWEGKATEGDLLALEVVALFKELDEFTREVFALIACAAEKIAAVSLAAFDFHPRGKAPDIRRTLSGSIHRAAP